MGVNNSCEEIFCFEMINFPSIDVNYALGSLDRVDVGRVTDFSEVYVAYIFRTEVNMATEYSWL
jgi:hypothetical protein